MWQERGGRRLWGVCDEGVSLWGGWFGVDVVSAASLAGFLVVGEFMCAGLCRCQCMQDYLTRSGMNMGTRHTFSIVEALSERMQHDAGVYLINGC